MKPATPWDRIKRLWPLAVLALALFIINAAAPEGWPAANTWFVAIVGILGWGIPALLRALKFHEWLADNPKWGKLAKFGISWGLSIGIAFLAAWLSGKLKEWKNLNDIMAMIAYARVWVEFAYNALVKTWLA